MIKRYQLQELRQAFLIIMDIPGKLRYLCEKNLQYIDRELSKIEKEKMSFLDNSEEFKEKFKAYEKDMSEILEIVGKRDEEEKLMRNDQRQVILDPEKEEDYEKMQKEIKETHKEVVDAIDEANKRYEKYMEETIDIDWYYAEKL